jgi:hypothetical protein
MYYCYVWLEVINFQLTPVISPSPLSNYLTRENINNTRKAHEFYVEQTSYLPCHQLTLT